MKASEMSSKDVNPESNQLSHELGFDPETLRKKYASEREKRLREEGNNQYIEVKGDFSSYVDDPYIESKLTREPLYDEVDVAIVGGGFSALILGARLREQGIKKIRLIEKGGEFGGTWYWNRYPGAACDVESYTYLPLLEELGYIPERNFANGQEIRNHCEAIAKKYDLYSDACLQTEVTGAEWDESKARWQVNTNRQDAFTAKYLCIASGPLNRPKLPGITGIDSFQGHTFHTSRWDYRYTGGNSEGGLSHLKDKRVGVIGTGATAIQCVPHLGKDAKQLFVFQRTPSSVDVRNERKTDPEWVKSLEPGWQKKRIENFTTLTSGGFASEDLIKDAWTSLFGKTMEVLSLNDDSALAKLSVDDKIEIADFQKMNELRDRVDTVVADAKTAESLKAWYRQLCKRPCIHNDYLKTFNLPNVELVDTNGKGVERITEKGVVVEGVEYELDCLIFATGFEVGTDYTRRSGFDLKGKLGLSLQEKWSEGMSTLHGISTNGFPNLFLINNNQATLTANYPHCMEEQSSHIAHIVNHCEENNISMVEVESKAESEWVNRVNRVNPKQEEFLNNCTPGFYNNEGKSQEEARKKGASGINPDNYFSKLKSWREAGTFDGFKFK